MGWNGSDRQSKSGNVPAGKSGRRTARPRRWRGLVAGGIVVALAGAVVVAVRMQSRPHTAAEPADTQPIRTSHPATVPAVSPSPRPTIEPDAATNSPFRRWRGIEVVSVAGVSTNLDGAVVEQLVLADGRKVKSVTMPPPVFKHASDQLLAIIVSAEPGAAIPPLPLGADIEQSFAESLLSPIADNPDDPDNVRELKQRVRDARKIIAEEIRAGKSVLQVLNECQSEANFMADCRLAAIREMQAIRAEDGDDAAAKYAESANRMLRERGVPAIPVPGKSANGEEEE